MAQATFTSKLQESGIFTIPNEAINHLGIHVGDEVEIRAEVHNGSDDVDIANQEFLQQRFDRFLSSLDTMNFTKPPNIAPNDFAEDAFADEMDSKFDRLGFRL